jgi:hypothetical protein
MTKQWPYILLAFLLPILAAFWWWGAFDRPEVQVSKREAVHYAYLVSQGDYSKVEDRQREVLDLLKRQNIQAGEPLTLIETDPRTTPGPQRKAQAGIAIPPEAQPQPPLLHAVLPERDALVVSASGHPFFVYGKAYGALIAYLGEHGQRLRLPIAETVKKNTLTIEMALEP